MTFSQIEHPELKRWIEQMIQLCKPKDVHLATGSDEEFVMLAEQLVKQGSFIKLNESKRPNSYLCRSDPKDVARVESRTFICSKHEDDAGPTNHWKDPKEMKQILFSLFDGCMKGRTMYIIPFCMGPLQSPLSVIGIEITDSAYVVCNMKIMARMGEKVLKELGKDKRFIPCMHSVGMPLEEGQRDVAWPCNNEQKYITHFPETREIWSYGSGYGGNALLGKKCLALRIASILARDEGWMAEHMLIMGVTNPKGKKRYFAAAFPSACGKTNLAMLQAQLPGWEVECVGDDIAWLHFGKDGQLYAINPETGFFGVAPGTSKRTNPNAMVSLEKNSIFTNVALTDDDDVWWEGMTEELPEHLIDWKGKDWVSTSKEKAAHPNARFTAPIDQCPIADPAYDDPKGVPISGIIFGGRREKSMPLVVEAFDWNHGCFLGAALSSETTAAAADTKQKVRHDPFAMLPFCGYHMGDYFDHWFKIGAKSTSDKLPKIFHVNWFRKGEEGQFLWPGFSDNLRVIKWMFDRIEGECDGVSSPIGFLPKKEDLNLEGLNLVQQDTDQLLSIREELWKEEVKDLKTYFSQFGGKLPLEIKIQLEKLEAAL